MSRRAKNRIAVDRIPLQKAILQLLLKFGNDSKVRSWLDRSEIKIKSKKARGGACASLREKVHKVKF